VPCKHHAKNKNRAKKKGVAPDFFDGAMERISPNRTNSLAFHAQMKLFEFN
jgi:hypothetical protein